ncbi:MAG: multidrug effflux MFS transporter [Rhodospirillaceae bacterium]
MAETNRPAPTHWAVTVLLVALAAYGPVSTDLYLPSLPEMTRHFSVSVSYVQLTLSIFTLGFSFGMLIHGPLSDRWGRRPILLIGALIYVVGSVVCVSAQSIDLLLAGRFIQALGASAGIVVCRAVVRDVYGQDGAARMFSYISGAMAFAPAVAPILGGALHVAFGFRANFVALLVFGLVILVGVWLLLRETNAHRDPRAGAPLSMLRAYGTLVQDRVFLRHCLTNAFIFAGLFSFISGSSFVVIDVLGVSEANFGFVFMFAACSYASCALLGGRLMKALGGGHGLIAIGVGVSAVTGLIGAGLAWTGVQSLWVVMPFVCAHFAACALVIPAGMGGAIGPYPKMAGAASSLMGFIQMGTGALIGAMVGLLHDGTTRVMMTAIALSALFAALTWIGLRGKAATQI